MPQQKSKPSTAAQRAEEALEKVAPAGKSPARRTLAFLLEGSHEPPSAADEKALLEPITQNPTSTAPVPEIDQTRTSAVPAPNPTQTSTRPVPKTAPERDFNRRANSLEREALPAGVFPGSSKKIYDALYFRTRGAIKPVRSIQATRRDLMQWTGIKNVKTIHDHTRRLIAAGLIIVIKLSGDHEGSHYEVFLPEETDQYQTHTSTAPEPLPIQISVRDQYQKTVRVGSSNLVENTATYVDPKTSFKTNTESDDDDAALAGLYAVLKAAATEVTGKGLSLADRDRWSELGEVLATELKIAAARTTVSSAPSFLTEHLRRRLWKKDKGQLQAEAASSSTATSQLTFSADQIAKCPDCGGSGFFYPQGYEGGVAKCKHEKLEATSTPEQKRSDQA